VAEIYLIATVIFDDAILPEAVARHFTENDRNATFQTFAAWQNLGKSRMVSP
jgi:hypothetical protein